ncbi:hypothetical protein [Symbiobacterium thermophilum]|uniref:Uncharacterized protein n=1 Tax=Symbiobacterium thermophilum (strain DSM 24528 / JCM 14929 / IAM 14863 / T) TaxID=292459 RepID=Q67TH6_SYMTH|nr:hypothetical protein [Symbiobacterium thermophilum]BAD39017.1 unknown protein [Symbiobacterium thermophilum IAM 14863]
MGIAVLATSFLLLVSARQDFHRLSPEPREPGQLAAQLVSLFLEGAAAG